MSNAFGSEVPGANKKIILILIINIMKMKFCNVKDLIFYSDCSASLIRFEPVTADPVTDTLTTQPWRLICVVCKSFSLFS